MSRILGSNRAAPPASGPRSPAWRGLFTSLLAAAVMLLVTEGHVYLTQNTA